MNKALPQQLREKLAVLDGSHNTRSMPRAAVRFEDLRHLKDLPTAPTARKATGETVPAEQYNSLLDDVTRLYGALGALAAVLSAKLPR